ncbi:magnesium/cobalt transporter CorA [Tumebacillus sp. ITR2]|uniref:Magnesium transport protein CorA n=1 Tax=Tumebacillus amylolyticus TaxID=2801339 RepID=A0ABS1JAE1_9BACL|nr:magnesium/cobalt transporter CorA [Tumebacillus amylolyticus]MBL0387242.1 magnesium/cobalt transporter CorA [Tumebacillus amylolyticus]
MIRTCAVTQDRRLVYDIPPEQLKGTPNLLWYWVDFSAPTVEEGQALADVFLFHPLAIEDCFHHMQRPKVDQYEDYFFFVMHQLDQLTLHPNEVDVFVGKNFVVSFHLKPCREIENAWSKFAGGTSKMWERGPFYAAYMIMDQLVDHYFPALYQIEEHLDNIEENTRNQKIRQLMNQVFDIRADLLQLRRTVVPMRDLLYRILHGEPIEELRKQKAYLTDVYDHLLRLAELIDSNREMTADLRDSYISLTSSRQNAVMVVMTVVTTIFMPLTLIVGIYGMNFDNMPELHTKYGYFVVLGVMAFLAVWMTYWFKRKGWFD